MGLRHDIASQVTAAMKSGDKERLSTLRMILSAMKYKEIDLKRELNDAEVVQTLSTLAKQRRDSIEQFKAGNRTDLAEKEEKELVVITSFMPAQMDEAAVTEAVKKIAAAAGASGPADMGKLMKAVMAELKGKADGKLVQEAVKKVLGGS